MILSTTRLAYESGRVKHSPAPPPHARPGSVSPILLRKLPVGPPATCWWRWVAGRGFPLPGSPPLPGGTPALALAPLFLGQQPLEGMLVHLELGELSQGRAAHVPQRCRLQVQRLGQVLRPRRPLPGGAPPPPPPPPPPIGPGLARTVARLRPKLRAALPPSSPPAPVSGDVRRPGGAGGRGAKRSEAQDLSQRRHLGDILWDTYDGRTSVCRP